MLNPIKKNFRGIILVSGPTKSGKSQLAEFLIKEQDSITYIATSKPRQNDKEWQKRILIHKNRRPDTWNLVEYPIDICDVIDSLNGNQSILLDSLGGIVEQHIMEKNDQWQNFQFKFVNCLLNKNVGIIIVSEEVGWGVVPSTPLGHIFRERLSNLSFLLSRHSLKKWLAINGMAIDIDKVGTIIP